MSERLAYSPTEVARQLGLSRQSVYSAVHRGEIPSVRIGGRICIPRSWLERVLDDAARPGVGIVEKRAFEREKQLISDALRNAAMRFGVALDLWSKEDLGHGIAAEGPASPTTSTEGEGPAASPSSQGTAGDVNRAPRLPEADPPVSLPANRVARIKERAAALATVPDLSLSDERKQRGLPTVARCTTVGQLDAWEQIETVARSSCTVADVTTPVWVDVGGGTWAAVSVCHARANGWPYRLEDPR